MKHKNKIIISIVILLIILITLFYILTPKGKLEELSFDSLKEKITNKEDFILCITSTTCSHCYDFKPKLEEVAKENNIIIYYINYDKYDVNEFKDLISFDGSTPNNIFIKNGEEETTSNRINGDVSKSKIIDKLKSNGFIK